MTYVGDRDWEDDDDDPLYFLPLQQDCWERQVLPPWAVFFSRVHAHVGACRVDDLSGCRTKYIIMLAYEKTECHKRWLHWTRGAVELVEYKMRLERWKASVESFRLCGTFCAAEDACLLASHASRCSILCLIALSRFCRVSVETKLYIRVMKVSHVITLAGETIRFRQHGQEWWGCANQTVMQWKQKTWPHSVTVGWKICTRCFDVQSTQIVQNKFRAYLFTYLNDNFSADRAV